MRQLRCRTKSLCNHADRCGHSDCKHAKLHECENAGYSMECIGVDAVVCCVKPETRRAVCGRGPMAAILGDDTNRLTSDLDGLDLVLLKAQND